MQQLSRRCLVQAAAAAATALAVGPAAWAQAFPNRPIRIIVPFGAGSSLDLLARLLAGPLGKSLGQPIVVENVTGAGGVAGTAQMVRAPRDGHTLALVNNSLVINPSIYKDMPYDTAHDIAPIAIVGNTPLVLVVSPKLPANNLHELIALARSRPGMLSYGSSGNGSVLHLAGVLLTSEAGVDIKHVPYKQSGQMLTDVASGTIDMAIYSIPAVLPQIQAGKMRALGVSTKEHSALLPNVPTLAESGLPGYDFGGWLALVAATGVPRPVIERLNAELKAALALKDVQEAMGRMDITPMDNGIGFAERFLGTELEKHADLVKRSGATLQ